jgi:hypothetical protein
MQTTHPRRYDGLPIIAEMPPADQHAGGGTHDAPLLQHRFSLLRMQFPLRLSNRLTILNR